jgi:purine-nucleoside phosphorylase
MTTEIESRLARALTSIHAAGGGEVEFGLVLGSGLGDIADRLNVETILPYEAIDGFARATAPGHRGRLLFGTWAGRRVALMHGRLHLYEGWSAADIALPIYTIKRLGARAAVLTNAAGALNPDMRPGEIMLIDDHINLTGTSPLTGPNSDSLGPRWVDLSRAHDARLRETAIAAGRDSGVALRRGVYVAIRGPEFETSAERRFMRVIGGDAVGGSTVHEVIAANHCGLAVLGLSAITNIASGGPDQAPDDADQIMTMARSCGDKMIRLLDAMLPRLG